MEQVSVPPSSTHVTPKQPEISAVVVLHSKPSGCANFLWWSLAHAKLFSRILISSFSREMTSLNMLFAMTPQGYRSLSPELLRGLHVESSDGYVPSSCSILKDVM